jgi:hypothetical protein
MSQRTQGQLTRRNSDPHFADIVPLILPRNVLPNSRVWLGIRLDLVGTGLQFGWAGRPRPYIMFYYTVNGRASV